eukprot:GILI01013484.1.p1 GENE.GILI01013484.1~~GILI01013484.1.p1  ORF type:complete len:448 (-),score=77.66 GILI01013484.1:123-1415(-)
MKLLVACLSAAGAVCAAGQYLSSPDYSYLPVVTYGGQSRDPSSWPSIISSSTSATQYPLCVSGSAQQQSPIAITSSVVDKSLSSLHCVTDAYPSLATSGGITTAYWWWNGADLRLTNFDVESSFYDPKEPGIEKRLDYISFHLGAGHSIGGSHADLEISMVFTPKSAYTSISQRRTIVSVIATSGTYSAHRQLAEIINEIPTSWGAGANGVIPSTTQTWQVPYVKGKFIDYRKFMPGRRSYFTYLGSEASPPCNPAQWYVMETPIHVSHQQLALLRNRTGAVNVAPQSALAMELVGTHRPVQTVADSTTVNRFEEIFLSTKYDDQPKRYHGDTNIVGMAVSGLVFAVIAMIISGFVIFENWRELIKIPNSYGVDKSLMQTIQADVANNTAAAAVSKDVFEASGRGKRGSSSPTSDKKYLKGSPASPKKKK